MNEYLKNKMVSFLKEQEIPQEKIIKIITKLEELLTPKNMDNDNLPNTIEVITPLYKGKVYLGEQAGKYFYKNYEGGIVISPSSKKIMFQKINKYLGTKV